MKRKITLPVFAVALAVALTFGTSSFSKSDPVKQPPKNYWVYNSLTTGFSDTAEYIMVSLDSEGDQNCPTGSTRPCVYKEATGSISTKAGLHTELQSLSSDANILSASLRKKRSTP